MTLFIYIYIYRRPSFHLRISFNLLAQNDVQFLILSKANSRGSSSSLLQSSLSKCQGQFPTTVLHHLKENVSIFFLQDFQVLQNFPHEFTVKNGWAFVWWCFFLQHYSHLSHLQSKKLSPKHPRLLPHQNGLVVLQ